MLSTTSKYQTRRLHKQGALPSRLAQVVMNFASASDVVTFVTNAAVFPESPREIIAKLCAVVVAKPR